MPAATVEPAGIPGQQSKRTQHEEETMGDLFVSVYDGRQHLTCTRGQLGSPRKVTQMSSAMTLSFRVCPDGTLVPGTTSGVFQLADGAPQTVTAPLNLPGSPGCSFIFWVAGFQVFPAQESGGVLESQQTVNFNAPAAQAFDATAWYLPAAGGGPGVAAWAFSVSQDTTLPDSPFGSVVPAAAQQSPDTGALRKGPDSDGTEAQKEYPRATSPASLSRPGGGVLRR
jgi:hypothetical protein